MSEVLILMAVGKFRLDQVQLFIVHGVRMHRLHHFLLLPLETLCFFLVFSNRA